MLFHIIFIGAQMWCMFSLVLPYVPSVKEVKQSYRLDNLLDWKGCFTALFSIKARKVVGGATGLIPSQFLEEKRKAFVRRDWDAVGSGQHNRSFCVPTNPALMLSLHSKGAEAHWHCDVLTCCVCLRNALWVADSEEEEEKDDVPHS